MIVSSQAMRRSSTGTSWRMRLVYGRGHEMTLKNRMTSSEVRTRDDEVTAFFLDTRFRKTRPFSPRAFRKLSIHQNAIVTLHRTKILTCTSPDFHEPKHCAFKLIHW